jgi:hypothetical protein
MRTKSLQIESLPTRTTTSIRFVVFQKMLQLALLLHLLMFPLRYALCICYPGDENKEFDFATQNPFSITCLENRNGSILIHIFGGQSCQARAGQLLTERLLLPPHLPHPHRSSQLPPPPGHPTPPHTSHSPIGLSLSLACLHFWHL